LRGVIVRDIVEQVILIVGGNDLSIKSCGRIRPSPLGVRGVREKFEKLVRDLQVWLPNANVTSLDIIPRKSTGWFNSRVRAISQHLVQHGRHHHALLHKNFYVDCRTKGSEKYVVVDQLYSGDGCHLNDLGYAILYRICEWLLGAERGAGEGLDFTASGRSISVQMKF
jgi:lysophospholipase L1-like esterase